MFYCALPGIFEKAKMLRQHMTQYEKTLWEELRSNKLLGLRFKAQHPIDTFIADFYCHKLKLVVEIDGDNHSSSDQSEYDHGRAYEMQKFGITTIRFIKNEIDKELGKVLFMLKRACESMIENLKLPSTPTLKGEADLNFETKKRPSGGWGQGT